MDFIIITGPQAVGKMSVGFELAKRTGLKVFHNHMTIEPVIRLFDFGSKEGQYLIHKFRREIFETMATSNEKGLIFTYVWAFNMESDHKYVQDIIDLFEKNGARVSIVELEADINERIKRNKTPLRLEEKPSKRNIKWSESDLINSMDQYRLNSLEGEIIHPNYIRINNTFKSPDEVSEQIIEYLNLKRIE